MIKKIIASVIATSMICCLTAFNGSAATYPIYTETSFTDLAEEALQEVCILSPDSAGMLVRGAQRRIDENNISSTPKLIESRTYVPLVAAEILFNAYTNVDTSSAVCDFRKYDFDKTTKISTVGEEAVVDGINELNTYVIYVNAEEYVPLRVIAEKLGNKIVYDNGYIVFGPQSFVDAIMENTKFYSQAKSIIDMYIPQTQGREIYVSGSEGNDENDGTVNSPYKTIEKANKVAGAGDTIIIKSGIYREIIKPVNNGTAAKPITYKAYGNDEVIINAADIVSDFQPVGNNLYQAPCTGVGEGRNQIFINGDAIPEARFPNIDTAADYPGISDISNFFATKGKIEVQEGDNKYFATSELFKNDEADKWKGATFVSLHGSGWTLGTAKIQTSSSDGIVLNDTSYRWWFDPASGDGRVSGNKRYGYITGTVNAIDTDYEWVVEDSVIKIQLPSDVDLNSFTVEAKARQLCIDLSSREYVRIEGIKTIGGGVNMNNTQSCMLNNCKFENISHYTKAYDQRDGFIEGAGSSNSAVYKGEVGIFISGRNSVVKNCEINESAGAGIYLSGLYTLVDNNKITNCGYMSLSGIYIAPYIIENYNTPRGGYVITHNEVRNSGRSVLGLQSANEWPGWERQAAYIPCEISYNKFVNGGLTAYDTGVVYFWGSTMGSNTRDTQFHHNAVGMETKTDMSMHSMIYHDNYINRMETYSNLMYTTNSEFTKTYDVYIQRQDLFPDSYAVVDCADNSDVGYVSSFANIAESAYPNGEYFKVGLR